MGNVWLSCTKNNPSSSTKRGFARGIQKRVWLWNEATHPSNLPSPCTVSAQRSPCWTNKAVVAGMDLTEEEVSCLLIPRQPSTRKAATAFCLSFLFYKIAVGIAVHLFCKIIALCPGVLMHKIFYKEELLLEQSVFISNCCMPMSEIVMAFL